MTKCEKITESTVPSSFFSIELSPISAETADRLSIAAGKANERIARNNQVYSSSNSHASSYATK